MPNTDNIHVTHRTNYGKVLVGSVAVDHNSIQWVGNEALDQFILRPGDRSLSFTGQSTYIPVGGGSINQWIMASSGNYSMGSPASGGAAPALGSFFAPLQASAVAAENNYSIQKLPAAADTKKVSITGEGVDDNESNPALTLDVIVNGAKSQQGEDVAIARSGITTFVITPRLNAGAVPAGAAPVEYVMVELYVREEGTGCTDGNLSFVDRCLTPNNFNQAQYFHYLEPSGPTNSPKTCNRTYSFLMRVNQSMQFQVTNTKDTGSGHVDYMFYIRGHLDFNNLSRWPQSKKVLKLTSTGPVVTKTRPVWPSLGNATMIEASGNSLTTSQVTFAGGVEVADKGSGDNGIAFAQHADVQIGGSINVFRSHVGQTANIIAVLGYQPNPATPMTFRFQTVTGEWQPWDGNVQNLGTKGTVTLQALQYVDLFDGPFTMETGGYLIYIAYRTQDGALLFNGTTPISFSVT